MDAAFDQIAMKYDYAFNVMTDEKSDYDFATCQSLPHKTEITETRTQPVEDIPGIIRTACFAAFLPAILTWHILIQEVR